jgi:hypothetical protein
LRIELHSETPGATVVYTLEPGDDVRWRLYTEPVQLPPARRPNLRAKAGRLGWYDSEEVHLD